MANPDRSVYDPPFDDDLMFDTVDEQEATRGRPLMILLGIVVVLAFAGVIWVAYRQGVEHAGRSEPPLLAQEPGPVRVAAPANQAPAVPDNPIYEEIGGAPAAAAPAAEALAPAAEEPAPLPPPSTAAIDPPPLPSPAESAPDVTLGEIPAATPSRTAAAQPTIPTEIAAEPPPVSPSVDPLAPGASLPPAPEFTAPAAEIAPPISAPPAPVKPSAAEVAAAKAEKDRLAKIAAAAKKAEAARIAEEKRLEQLAAATPAPSSPALETVPEITDPIGQPATPSAAIGPKGDASGRPTLLTPPSTDLPAPSVAAPTPAASTPAPSVPAATPAPSAAAPSPTRSEIVPDESPAPAASAASGQFVVQIGAFNSAEDAADSWKRMERSFSGALGGAAPEIRKTEVNGKTKYRLRATGYTDRNAANSACSRLKSAGQGCFVAAR